MKGTVDLERILADGRYQALVRRRRALAWSLSTIMVTAYLAFLLLVAFDKPLLARPIGGGVTSIGIVLGLGLILLAVALTAIYVRRAAREFDPLVDALQRDAEL